MLNRAEIGRLGEEIAEKFLKKRSFRILARNWKTPRWGELDLVARDGEILVIVEVKTRSRDDFGQPFEAVNHFKLKSIVRAGQMFRLLNPRTPEALRVDVVSIVLNTPPEIEYFQNVYQEP